MRRSARIILLAACCGLALGGNYQLALTDHPGKLEWSADGFKIVQSSAKANGQEIGLRGEDNAGHLMFLGFLFQVPGDAASSGDKCRDGILDQARKAAPSMRMLHASQLVRPGSLPVSLVNYTWQNRDGAAWYTVRGFVATGDICGDLELSSNHPINAEDSGIQKIFSTYKLDAGYAPQFSDIVRYAQSLFQMHIYKNAAPLFERTLVMVPGDGAPFPSARYARRVVTDQAGTAYRMAGELPKSRALFENAISADPDYPMYYYNLACIDAREKKLVDARVRLQQAFAQTGNLNPGEKLPDPTKEDSFLPYRSDSGFWLFLEHLQ